MDDVPARKGLAGPIIKGLVLVVCCWLVYRTVSALGPEKVWARAQAADPGWLIAAVLAVAARYVFWLIKWRTMLRRTADVPTLTVWHLIMANSFVNLVTPTAKIAGGFLRAMALKRRLGWSFPYAYGQVVADQTTHLLGKAALLACCLLWAALNLPQLLHPAAALGTGLLFLVIVLPWPIWRAHAWRLIHTTPANAGFQRKLRAYAQRVSGTDADVVDDLMRPLLTGGSPRAVLVGDILLSGLSFGVFCYSNALVLQSLGAPAPPGTVALVVLLGYLAGTLIGVMGGIGVTELFLMKLYASCGIEESAAATAALLHRGLFYGFLLLLGGISFLVVGRKI